MEGTQALIRILLAYWIPVLFCFHLMQKFFGIISCMMDVNKGEYVLLMAMAFGASQLGPALGKIHISRGDDDEIQYMSWDRAGMG